MNREKIEFSIIVPIYKVEKYLERCLVSILSQTYKNYEVILVDDGSPDSCPKLCDDYAKRCPFIKVIHKANGGLSSARNAGLDIASGSYIVFVDSDDYISVHLLERLHSIIKNYKNPDIVCYSYTSQEGIINIESNKICTNSYDTLNAYRLYEKSLISRMAWDKAYNKRIFDDLRFPEGKLAEDYAVTCRALAKAKTVVTTNGIYYFYTKRPDSITGSGFGSLKLAKDNYEIGENNYYYSLSVFPKLEKWINDEYVKLLLCCHLKFKNFSSENSDAAQECLKIMKKIRKMIFKRTTTRTKLFQIGYLFFPGFCQRILEKHLIKN